MIGFGVKGLSFGLALFLMSCNISTEMIDLSDKEHDFLRSELIASGPTPADGSSDLLVVAHLKNLDNTPIPGFKPDSVIVAGDGVTYQECTSSDSNGSAQCILRAIIPGKRTFKVANIKQIELEKEVEFKAPVPKYSRTGIVSGAIDTTTSAGHRVTAAVSYGGTIYTQTPEGHKVYRFSEGAILSE